MAATRKAQKEAEELRISQIGDFKKRIGGIMELPSSLIVRVRNPGGLQAFTSSGMIPNSLMTIIQKGMDSGKTPDAKEVVEKMDQKLLQDMNTLLDAITMRTIVEPKIHPLLTEADLAKWNKEFPEDPRTDVEELRRDDILYIDEIPDDDKSFLFQWISGGTRDLEEFRRKSDTSLDDVAAVAVIGGNAQSDNGTDAG